MFLQRPLHLEGFDHVGHALMIVPVALTVLAFFVLRAMARTALRLDDAEAATLAVRAAQVPELS